MSKLTKKELTEAVLLSSEAIELLVELATKLATENQRIRKQLSDLTHEVLATQHDLEILKMFILKD